MAKKNLVKSGPPVNMNSLQSDGGTLSLLDASGAPVSPQPTDAVATVAWISSDPTLLSVAPTAPGNTYAVTIKTVAPFKTGSATIQAVVTYVAGSPGPFTAVSPTINVTTPGPASADIVLGVPTP